MKVLVFAMPGNEAMAARVTAALGNDVQPGRATVRRFPDGESYVRVDGDVSDAEAVIVCTLDRPDDKLVPLLLLAAALRDSGAARVGLIAPYLAYMRQDIRFRAGETISAQHFARWLSDGLDWLVTADPHLHRIASLGEVYRVPALHVRAAPAVAAWIRAQVARPLLIGPDEESQQWVADVAARAGAPFTVLRKTRHGDHEVDVSVPDVQQWRAYTPVLVDDIVSTGTTMVETMGHLQRAGLRPAVCIAVHAVFAGDAAEALLRAGAAQVVSCDTIAHPSNRISLAEPLAEAARALIAPSAES